MTDSSGSKQDPAAWVSWALWQAKLAVDQAFDQRFAPLGLSTTLQGALRLVAEEPGQSAADLARRAGVRPQSAAQTVNRLEQLGLVARKSHAVHGRILQTYLTDSGCDTLAEAMSVFNAAEGDLTVELTLLQKRQLLQHLAMIRARAQYMSSDHRRRVQHRGKATGAGLVDEVKRFSYITM